MPIRILVSVHEAKIDSMLVFVQIQELRIRRFDKLAILRISIDEKESIVSQRLHHSFITFQKVDEQLQLSFINLLQIKVIVKTQRLLITCHNLVVKLPEFVEELMPLE